MSVFSVGAIDKAYALTAEAGPTWRWLLCLWAVADILLCSDAKRPRLQDKDADEDIPMPDCSTTAEREHTGWPLLITCCGKAGILATVTPNITLVSARLDR